MFFFAGYCVAALTGAGAAEAAQLGLSLVIWGAAVRTVIVWHVTWIVNSADHLWGYRNYDTPDGSRNSLWLGMLGNGDGWHNNHHADPRSARHGHEWREIDPAWMAIRLMMALGLAKNARLPAASLGTRFKRPGLRPAFDDFVPPEGDFPAPLAAAPAPT